MDLNFFKLCSGLKVLGYFMILLVAAIIAVSYYAVVVLTWGPQLLDGGFKSFLSFTTIAVFHVLLVLLIWSYFMVVLRDPGSVPENWKPVLEENLEEGGSTTLSHHVTPDNLALTWSISDRGQRRPVVGYCSRCQNGKPPRCHHCSVCKLVWFLSTYFFLFLMHFFLIAGGQGTYVGCKNYVCTTVVGKHLIMCSIQVVKPETK